MSAPWVPMEMASNPGMYTNIRYDVFVAGLLKPDTNQLMALHAALGTVEEAGELAGCIKRHQIYGKPLDSIMKEDGKDLLTHIKEEAGDVLFYVQAVLNLYGIPFEECLAHNVAKLGKRYQGLVYSDTAANERKDKNGTTEN